MVLGALGVSGAMALAADTATEDLGAQVNALQAKVESLEAKQLNTKDVDDTIRRILADADSRSQLMASEGFTAGYSKGKFLIQSADGNFVLHPYLQFQLRNVTNYREDFDSSGDADTQNGFEIRRIKFGFEGNAYSPKLTYQFQWATDRNSGNPVLDDAWAKYQFADHWAVMGGEFKDPLFRESLVSSTRQLAADRSLLNNILEGNDNYVEGASLLYAQDRLHVQSAFTNGFGSANANFIEPQGNPGDADYTPNGNRKYKFGVATRADYMVLGDPDKAWKQYSQFSAQGATGDMLVLGAAGEWAQAGDANTYWYTADAQWIPAALQRLSVYGALVGRTTEVGSPELATQDSSVTDSGFLVQAGYLLNNNIEPFVRYDYLRANQDLLSDSAAAAYGTRDIHEITAGVNYYLKGQNAKFTLDLTYLPNGTPIGSSGAGILSQPTEQAQWLARVQFQLVL